MIRLSHRLAALLTPIFGLLAFTSTITAYEGVTLSIPTLQIESRIIEFPLNGTGWDIDPWEDAVGHLEGTAWFGESGNIALGGHSTLPDFSAGVFGALDQVALGETIVVHVNGEEQLYSVSGITHVTPDDLSVLYPSANEQLTLITCDTSSFDSESSTYLRRTIVRAQRIR